MTEKGLSSTTPAPGDTLLHYQVLGQLGRGGMGEILLARDTRLDRRVAIKILPPEFVSDPERLARFRREARTLAALNHPNIVTIFAVEELNGLHFLIMELVDGATLKQLIPAEGMALGRFFDLALPLAEGLHAANQQGITHRDLKPENVMVTTSGRVKILDFGLAKPAAVGAGDGSLDELTRDGLVLGTMPYMSPEQLQGKGVDHRSDIFSLGIMLYQMLTGRRPFAGDTPASLISSILRDTPSSLSSLRSGLPPELARVVTRCLEKDPANRYQDALELHQELRDLERQLLLDQAMESGHTRRTPSSGSGRATALPRSPLEAMLGRRLGLTALLGLVFVANYLETAIENALKAELGLGVDLGYRLAGAVHWLEGFASFEGHDVTNRLAIYGYSASYFFVLPALGLLVAVVLARRQGLTPFRVFCLAVGIDYAISLPFFMLFPIPERWAFPESGAILLSDLWTSKLIEAFRPISGLDNCFPSFHTSLTVVIVLVCYVYRLRFRHSAAALGATIVLATLALGIHWVADIVSGLAVGVLSVVVALRLERRLAPAALTGTTLTDLGLSRTADL